MPNAIGEFGYIDAMRYADWLHAVALLQQGQGRSTYNDVVIARLSDPQLDPRKVLGYLVVGRGENVLTDRRAALALRGPAERAMAFAQQFPSHPTLTNASQRLAEGFARAGIRLSEKGETD